MTDAENLARAGAWAIRSLVPVNGWEWAHPELVRGITDACAAAVRAARAEDANLVNVADVVDATEDPRIKLKIFDALGIAAYRICQHLDDIPPPPVPS